MMFCYLFYSQLFCFHFFFIDQFVKFQPFSVTSLKPFFYVYCFAENSFLITMLLATMCMFIWVRICASYHMCVHIYYVYMCVCVHACIYIYMRCDF